MMDPFTVLGISANILQFIECGINLARDVRELQKKGSVADYECYDGIYNDLKDVCVELSSKTSMQIKGPMLSKHDQAIQQLTNECIQEAQKLIQMMEKVTSKVKSSKSGSLLSFQASLRTVMLQMWHGSDIDALEERLQNYRSELGLRLLVALNDSIDSHGKDVVEVLSINKSIQSKVEAIAAIVVHNDGGTETLLPRSPIFYSLSLDSQTAGNSILYRADVDTSGHGNSQPKSTVLRQNVRPADVFHTILNALWFHSMNWRQRTIIPAHRETCKWIFEAQSPMSPSWSDFTDWLARGEGAYWINGKAGSGKSTLMKFVGSDPRLLRGLKQWTGDKTLSQASCYIYRSSQQPLQRTQEGLLRTLLHQILERRSDLIPVCFPGVCRTLMIPSNVDIILEITSEELKVAFSTLIKELPTNIRLFLLIDGLDEYDGQHREILDLVLQATRSTNTKVLVSSRPLPLCYQAFAGCPTLDVKKFTERDMGTYVENHLCQDTSLREMDIQEQGIMSLLIKQGLGHYERREALLKRLESLPPELEELYDHMLGSISIEYQKEGSLMFQLLIRSMEIQVENDLSVLQMSFAEEEDPKACLTLESTPMSQANEELRCKATEGRMRSRCCGLIESQNVEVCVGKRELKVVFFHRTVIEYLTKPQIWEGVVSHNPKEQAVLDKLLLSSSLSELKCKGFETSLQRSSQTRSKSYEFVNLRPVYNVLHGLKYCWSLQQMEPDAEYLQYVTEFRHLLGKAPAHGYPSFDAFVSNKLPIEGFGLQDMSFHHGFLVYSAANGLGTVVSHFLQDSFQISAEDTSLLLLHLLINLNKTPSRYALEGAQRQVQIQQLAISTKAVLGRQGINPNLSALFWDDIETANVREDIREAVRCSPSQDNDLNPWIYWLSCGLQQNALVRHQPLLYFDIFEAMLIADADLQSVLGSNSVNSRGKKSGKTVTSILTACKQCLMLLRKDVVEEKAMFDRINTLLQQAEELRNPSKAHARISRRGTFRKWLRTKTS